MGERFDERKIGGEGKIRGEEVLKGGRAEVRKTRKNERRDGYIWKIGKREDESTNLL
jgi:hypothetical protein